MPRIISSLSHAHLCAMQAERRGTGRSRHPQDGSPAHRAMQGAATWAFLAAFVTGTLSAVASPYQP